MYLSIGRLSFGRVTSEDFLKKSQNISKSAFLKFYVRLTENKPGICLAAMKYADERWIRNNMSHGVEYAIIWDETANFLKNCRGGDANPRSSNLEASALTIQPNCLRCQSTMVWRHYFQLASHKSTF